MRYTAVNAKHNFGMLLDEVQHNPITITRHNRDIAVIYSNNRIETVKKNVLGEHFLALVEAGEIDFLEALEQQTRIMQDVERSRREIDNGQYEEASPEFFANIKNLALNNES